MAVDSTALTSGLYTPALRHYMEVFFKPLFAIRKGVDNDLQAPVAIAPSKSKRTF